MVSASPDRDDPTFCVVGASVYDGVLKLFSSLAESTTIIAANLVHEFLEMIIHDKPPVGFRSSLRKTLPSKTPIH